MIHYHNSKYKIPETDFSDNPHWKLATAVWALVAATAASAGSSAYSSAVSSADE